MRPIPFCLFPVHALKIWRIGAMMSLALLLAPSDADALLVSSVSCGGTLVGTNSVADTCNGPLNNPWTAGGSASANAGSGLVSGASRISASVGTRRTSPGDFTATSRAEYVDDFSFAVLGLAPGEAFTLRPTIGMSGTTDVRLGDPLRGFATASADLALLIRGAVKGGVSVIDENGVLIIDNPIMTFDLGLLTDTVTPITLRMRTRAFLRNDSGFGSSSAEADFSRTGGIIGFEYFALDGTPLSGTFSTASGNFSFYDPTGVPEPGTAWLLASALALLGRFQRRSRAADWVEPQNFVPDVETTRFRGRSSARDR